MSRPNGMEAELVLVGIARDMLTGADGAGSEPAIFDTGSFSATIDYRDAQRIVALSSTPAIAGLDTLVGRSASTGFRAALNAAVDGQELVGHPVYQLLDDLPVATLISGFAPQQAMARAGAWGPEARSTLQRRAPEGLDLLQQADLCAGWKAGGTIIQGLAEGLPPVVTGPDAPSLDRDDDPWAWHAMPGAMGTDAMRRRRRIDVIPAVDGAPLVVDAHFRDSHVDDEGLETIVHEYTVVVQVDPIDFQVLESRATPHVLPWFECPEAAASATRLVGDGFAGLRARVRAEFVGATTCTHLNDAAACARRRARARPPSVNDPSVSTPARVPGRSAGRRASRWTPVTASCSPVAPVTSSRRAAATRWSSTRRRSLRASATIWAVRPSRNSPARRPSADSTC